MTNYNQNTESGKDQVLIERIFDAPREMVFKAWTDLDQLLKWYAPTGCEISFSHLDVKEGGYFHSCILTPDGKECWCKGVYKEVKYPEKIVHTMAVASKEGDLISSVDAGMDPEWPDETTLTITFVDINGKTKLTLHQTVSESLAKRTGAHPSWLIMFDRLDNLFKKIN